MGKYFGTDGFRGKAGEVLTAEHAFKIGRFLGWYYKEKHYGAGSDKKARIVIGKDTRRSSYMYEAALSAGIKADVAAGLSLGEYGALYAANVIDFEQTIKLISKRAEAMEEVAKFEEQQRSMVHDLPISS